MAVKNYIDNQKGVTLLEILLAITILSIVFIAFFTFFIQSAKFTQFNKEKLTAVQVAEEVIADIHEGVYTSDASFEKDGYSIQVEISDGPSGLKKAAVTVKPMSVSEMDQSFQTEMYFEGPK